MKVPLPCSLKWSSFEPLTELSRHCSQCNQQVIDFTKSTKAYFDQKRNQYGPQLCGRFATNESGEIEFRKGKSIKHFRFAFLLALSIGFHTTLFSNIPLNWASKWQEIFVAQPPDENTTTLYGQVTVGRDRFEGANVRITLNDTYIIETTTDEKGRFSFDVKTTMFIEKMAIQANNRTAVVFDIMESADDASKRIYKAKYRAYRFTGCPSF